MKKLFGSILKFIKIALNLLRWMLFYPIVFFRTIYFAIASLVLMLALVFLFIGWLIGAPHDFMMGFTWLMVGCFLSLSLVDFIIYLLGYRGFEA